MDHSVQKYLSEIGRKGGRKSRRALSPEAARDMVKVREARRAFARFKTSCFWSFDPTIKITLQDVPWVVEQLRKHGNRSAWETANSLCR
jgi:hypothetical protein